MAGDVLVVDDEADIRDLVSGILEDEGYQARQAAGSDSAFAAIATRLPSLVILDIWLQGSQLDGLVVLTEIKKLYPELPVVMISGHGTIETAVAAIKLGAYDFIEKPFETDRLLLLVKRAIETANLRRENKLLRVHSNLEEDMIGSSVAMQMVRSTIAKTAPMSSRVLITGNSGTGKEVAARLLHRMSKRADGPFVVINAASMAPDRLEIELFGVEANATSDGIMRFGLFEQAHGGTLFIDDVADMPITTQAKILRILVDQSFERVGGRQHVQVDVRVVSATSRDLNAEIEAKRFRDDLYHRINVIPINIPPLINRREDIPELVEHFIKRIAMANGIAVREISKAAMTTLQMYDWPGNVRQLRNICERLLIIADDSSGEIGVDCLPAEVSGAEITKTDGFGVIMSLQLKDAREAFERDYLESQIARFGYNISKTAAFIGMERTALHRKLKSLNINI